MPLEILEHPRSRWIAVAVACLLAVAGVSVLLLRLPTGPVEEQPTPTPPPRIEATSQGIATYPGTDPETQEEIAAQLESFLADLYTRTFLPEVGSGEVRAVFTPDAYRALGEDPDAFRAGSDEVIREARVRFDGAVTLDGDEVRGALLSVRFTASGVLLTNDEDEAEDEDTPRWTVELRQAGELLVLRFDDGWRVAGFDAALEVERVEVPTVRPTEEPR